MNELDEIMEALDDNVLERFSGIVSSYPKVYVSIPNTGLNITFTTNKILKNEHSQTDIPS